MKANRTFMAAITTLVMAVTLLASCRDARVYDHFEPVNDDGWGRNDTVCFAISRQKSCEVDVNLSQREGTAYRQDGYHIGFYFC